MEINNCKEIAITWRLEELHAVVGEFESAVMCAVNESDIKVANDYKNFILRTVGKSIVTMKEVIILSANGYADGALSLARNLYEQCITVAFLDLHKQDENYANMIRNYFLDYDLQCYKNLKYIYEGSEKADEYQQKIQEVKDNAHTSVNGTYWWAGKATFNDLFQEIQQNAGDSESEELWHRLHVFYKRACLGLHANCFGNMNRLGTHDEFAGIDTSPQQKGHGFPLCFAVASFSYIVAATCLEFAIDYKILYKEKLNDLEDFYARFLAE